MDYAIVELPQRCIVGPTIRTANDAPDCAQSIGALWQKFMANGMERSIPEVAVDPYTCFGLYYDYDMKGNEYNLLIGCETNALAPQGMELRTIPAGRYAKFEIRGGDCVNSVIEAWNTIWADEDLTTRRAFTVDFEAYYPLQNENSADIDIFVALK